MDDTSEVESEKGAGQYTRIPIAAVKAICEAEDEPKLRLTLFAAYLGLCLKLRGGSAMTTAGANHGSVIFGVPRQFAFGTTRALERLQTEVYADDGMPLVIPAREWNASRPGAKPIPELWGGGRRSFEVRILPHAMHGMPSIRIPKQLLATTASAAEIIGNSDETAAVRLSRLVALLYLSRGVLERHLGVDPDVAHWHLPTDFRPDLGCDATRLIDKELAVCGDLESHREGVRHLITVPRLFATIVLWDGIPHWTNHRGLARCLSGKLEQLRQDEDGPMVDYAEDWDPHSGWINFGSKLIPSHGGEFVGIIHPVRWPMVEQRERVHATIRRLAGHQC